MNKRNIIVIGASAGGFEALKTLVSGFPEDLDASILIVWHMSPEVRGVLPQVLDRVGKLPAAVAVNGETIKTSRIYVAPPDRHLLVADGKICVTRGPKENLFRPAVDPLFRSAAYGYRDCVIGVVLSGGLDDGTAGLWTIKNNGGLTIVQDPMDAEVPSMPENAIREVAVDYVVPVSEMAGLIVTLSQQEVIITEPHHEESVKLRTEIGIAAHESAFEAGILELGELTPFTCPECHGVLSRLTDGHRHRYRCHTGHAFSADALMAAITANVDDNLYNAIRGMEESIMLLNHVGDHYAERNQPKFAAIYFKKARDVRQKVAAIRNSILNNEHFTIEFAGQSQK